jgi:hypothetical protein
MRGVFILPALDYQLLRAGLIQSSRIATKVHDSITPFGAFRLRTLHEQGIEVTINTEDVVGIILVVDPHELTTIVNRIKL